MSEFVARDPRSGAWISARPSADAATIDAALARSASSQASWSRTPMSERAAVLRAIAGSLRKHAPLHAQIMVQEMGKPLSQALAEIEKCAWTCEVSAERAEGWLAPEAVATEARATWVRHDPLGVVLAVMPWNFPFWQLFRFAAGAWMAGNTVVLKHAPNVPGCADAIVEVLRDAGAGHLIENLFLGVSEVERVIADRRVAGVTLTGSTRAGIAVATACARSLKPSVLELGGSDPFIVLADADLDAAAATAAKARLQNNGQSCIAAKRFLVEAPVAGAFVERFQAALASTRVGDPMDPATELGPMARSDLRDALHAQVQASVAGGGKLVMGGAAPDRDGWWYPATLVLDAGGGMPVWSEETFGPAAAVRVVADAAEAVRLANDTPFGLGASLWSRDLERAQGLAPQLRAGAVFVNGLVKSDPRLPFGGVGESGWGRELGREGQRAFTVTRSVWVS